MAPKTDSWVEAFLVFKNFIYDQLLEKEILQ